MSRSRSLRIRTIAVLFLIILVPCFISADIILTPSPAFFSPNGDAYQDTSTISGTSSLVSPTWSLLIKNSQSITVRTVNGSGQNISFQWNGKDDAAQNVAADRYTVDVSATDGTNTENGTTTVSLANVVITKNATQFKPSSSQTVTYTSNLPSYPFALTETLKIYPRDCIGGSCSPARILVSPTIRSGTYNDVWDGKNDSGVILKDAPYFYVATISDGVNTMTWDLTQKTTSFNSNHVMMIEDFDPFNNLPLVFGYDPGWFTGNNGANMSIIVSPTLYSGSTELTCNPAVNNICVLQSEYQDSGDKIFRWAGIDVNDAILGGFYQTGTIPYRAYIYAIAEPFPANAVVLYGTKPVVADFKLEPPLFNPFEQDQNISFTVSTHQNVAANITITIKDQFNSPPSVIKTINSVLSPGEIDILWDGKADTGLVLKHGYYLVTVSVTDSVTGSVAVEKLFSTIRY